MNRYRKDNILQRVAVSVILILSAIVAKADRVIFSTGFEEKEGFSATTNYQGTVTDGPLNRKWTVYYGCFSTTSAITDRMSTAIRLYASSIHDYGYLKTNFSLQNVTRLSFKAKAANTKGASIRISVLYSVDGESWKKMLTETGEEWNASSLSTVPTDYSAFLPESIRGNNRVFIKIAVSDTSIRPSSDNAQLTIDDIIVYGESTKEKPRNVWTGMGYEAKMSEDNVYPVFKAKTDGKPSYASSSPKVADIDAGNGTISLVKEGTTIISCSTSETKNYKAGYASYTLISGDKASLPFFYNQGKNGISTTKGITAEGLGNDYARIPLLKFDSSSDNVTIHFDHEAKYLEYTIIGHEFYDGVFEVMESSNGENYSVIESHKFIKTTAEGFTCSLSPSTRFVKFSYTRKERGNVGLGKIALYDGYVHMNISEGTMGTICLDRDANAEDIVGGKVYSVVGYKGTRSAPTHIIVEEKDCINAGTPYIYITSTDEFFVAFRSISSCSQAGSSNGLVGTFEDNTMVPDGSYVIGSNSITKSSENAHVDAYHAYIDFDGVPEDNDETKEKRMLLKITDTSGIDKISVNGESETIYNLNGQRISTPTKGVYIRNKEKVVVR